MVTTYTRILLVIFFAVFQQALVFSQINLVERYFSTEKYQNPIVHQWTTENGLPQNSVNAIVQTPDNFIWLATYDGLIRFDGVNFTSFNIDNTPVLGTNRIRNLFLASDKSLWIGTENGGIIKYKDKVFTDLSNLFNPVVGAYITFTEDAQNNIWAGFDHYLKIYDGSNLKSIDIDANSQRDYINTISALDEFIYVGTNKGIKVYSPDGNFVKDELESFYIMSMTSASDGVLWVGTSQGLYSKQKNYSKINDVPITNISSLFSAGNYLLIGTDYHQIFVLNKSEEKVYNCEVDLLNNTKVMSFETDHEGNLWLGTNVEGLLLLRDRFINTLTEDDGLGVNITYPLFKSRDGGIWVGTNCGGFSKITKEGIKTFRADEQNVINECVWSLYEDDDGTLWIGTFGGGLYKFDGRNFTQYSFNQGMPTNAVFAVMRASDGVLWIGTGNGLCKLVDEEITVYQTDDGLVNNHVNYLAEDDNGSLWISTSGGLSKFSNGEFTNYSQENGFPANSIRFIHFDDDNNLWIGSYGNGLIHYKNNKFTKIDKSNGLFDNVVSTIAEDDFGNFWMTCNKGLFRAEKSELLKFINGETNFINSVFYQKNDGLLSNEFNGGSQPSSLKYPDGTLWLPNLNGVVVVDPAKVNFNSAPPKLFIDKVVIDDSIFVETNSIEFSSSTEKIEISYTALSFSATQNVKFQHKLEGLEKDWSKTTYDRKIIYRLLPPGEYKFKLRACNSDGVWNTEGASINIIVRAMFYETLYFYVGVSILLIIAVWFIYKIRMLNLEKRKSELEIQVNERTASLQKEKEKVEQVLHEVELARKEIENQRDIAERMNQHKTEMMRIVTHNLKNPVGSIKSSVELINSDLDDKEMAEEMLGLIKKAAEEMLDSIQQLLESSKIEDENIKMNFEKVSLIFLIEKLISACEPQVNRKNQTIDFIYDPEKYIEVRADGGKLSAAIENLISNAVKYSPKGKIITVSLNSEPGESVTICVKDEGPGLSEEDKEKVFGKFQKLSAQPTGEESSTGLGLSIVKRIVELHNGKVWVESEAGKGAKFCIHLPTNLN